MKKWKIVCIISIITICSISYFNVFADNFKSELTNWAYNLGSSAKKIIERPVTLDNENIIVAYVNDIPVYKSEILERDEKNKNLTKIMKSTDNQTPPWSTNPIEYVYKEKFELSYAKNNGIEVSDDEVKEYMQIQKSGWESEELKEVFEQYLAGSGITEEQFYNDIAPAEYEKTILNGKVKKHILQNTSIDESNFEEVQEYLQKFYEENVVIKEVDKNFIEMYNK